MFEKLKQRFYSEPNKILKDKNENNEIESIQIEVENKCKFPVDSMDAFQLKINDIIICAHSVDALPYNSEELLSPKKNQQLREYGITRDSHTRVVLRGDSRSIQEIKEVGGFHPNCTSRDYISDWSKKPQKPLDVAKHRSSSGTMRSGFVSTTVNQATAHLFGKPSLYNRKSNSTYTIYSLLATGAMTPAENLWFREKEYSVPGGIDYEDIIAYRECRFLDDSHFIKCSDIFFNKKFAKKYPHLVDEVLHTQLLKDETISLSRDA